jgi:hypothetical protein
MAEEKKLTTRFHLGSNYYAQSPHVSFLGIVLRPEEIFVIDLLHEAEY